VPLCGGSIERISVRISGGNCGSIDRAR
jgi:hypothetical protein